MSLKAGQSVRIKTSPYMAPHLQAGETGKVLEIKYNNASQCHVAVVKMDNGWCGLGSNAWGFPVDYLEATD